ncbi:VOC family protein [Kribbella sp. DT2]|uniref:VOC family protein n=1 Tax=Kribbella sp. DT2 TaxID=3393427 RepID=UPI003CF0BD6E
MSAARFKGLLVMCVDVAATAAIYEEVLGFERREEADGDVSMTVGVDGAPGATVEIYLHPAKDAQPTRLGTYVVDDVDATVQILDEAGCTVTSPPDDTPWGSREASVRDQNGHEFTFTAPTRG